MISLSFSVQVQCETTFSAFITWFIEKADFISWSDKGILTALDNIILLEKNSLADISRISESDGFLFYCFTIHVITSSNVAIGTAKYNQQLDLARRILILLNSNNCRAEIIDEIGDYL